MAKQPEFLIEELNDTNANNIAQDYINRITISPKYKRPVFLLPDLSSELGNTLSFAGAVYTCLTKHGFKPEAEMLAGSNQMVGVLQAKPLMITKPYEEHADILSRFLRLINPYDTAFDKKSIRDIKNYDLFNRISGNESNHPIKEDEIKSLSQEELSSINNFGRNILYYAKDPKILKILLTRNKQEHFLEAFQIDVFGQSPLHGVSTINQFNMLSQYMYDVNKEKFKKAFISHDVFGNGCFMTLNKVLANTKIKYRSSQSTEETQEIYFAKIAKAIAFGCFAVPSATKELLNDINETEENGLFSNLIKNSGIATKELENIKPLVNKTIARTREYLLKLNLQDALKEKNNASPSKIKRKM